MDEKKEWNRRTAFLLYTIAYGKYKTFHICIRHRVSLSYGWKYKDTLFKDKYKELSVLFCLL